jgi:hypothetical protein
MQDVSEPGEREPLQALPVAGMQAEAHRALAGRAQDGARALLDGSRQHAPAEPRRFKSIAVVAMCGVCLSCE